MPFYTRDLPVELRGTKSGFQEMARNWRRRECMAIVDELNAKLLLVGSTPLPQQQQHMIAGYNAPIDSQLPTASSSPSPSSSSSSSATQSDHHHLQKRTPSTSFIVTAHTYDDQLETLLMKLVRGVHIANFQPMQTVDDSLIFFKPLLQLTKQQLTDYLMVRGLQWREDRSNQDNEQYKRNKVRLQLVPLMSELAGTACCNSIVKVISVYEWIYVYAYMHG
jgi:tRNA(Ile)-lysidine synthase TilS/MesJ